MSTLQRQILDELRTIRGLLEAFTERVRPLDPDDRAVLERLLPVIREHIGGGAFSTHELHDIARMESVAGNDMRLALGRLDTREAGILFKRAADAGFGLRRIGENSRGARWELMGVSPIDSFCGDTGPDLEPQKRSFRE